jgi:hypothetical protein
MANIEDTQEQLTVIGQVVRVSIPREVAYNLDRFQEVQKGILGKLGCMACCSGWDIRWEFERRFLVDSQLNVREP